MKYLVWQDGNVAGQFVSQGELTFTGPRRGVASWLGKPRPLGSLDFASPEALMVVSLVLADPSQVFDDVKQLSGSSGTGAFANIAQVEKATKLNLKVICSTFSEGKSLRRWTISPREHQCGRPCSK
jgi:hypothetical protein